MTMSYSDQVTIDTATSAVQGSGATYDTFAARHSGKCLDVVSSSTADCAAVKQYTCSGGSNQQWESL